MNKALNIQELALVVAAKNHNPAVLTPDFLKYSGIVPEDWELAQQPVTSNRVSQVVFKNGVSIVAQPDQIVFSESIAAKEAKEVNVPEVAKGYLQACQQIDNWQIDKKTFNEIVNHKFLAAKESLNTNLLVSNSSY